jgi:nicotinamidase-related amidase
MPVDVAALLDPAIAAVVTQECQEGVIGEGAPLAELAAAARATVVPNGARLVRAARAKGVPVVHCVAARREDGLGSNTNARLFAAMRQHGVALVPGSRAVEVVEEFGVAPADVVLTRLHGLGPMGGTELDAVLRNLGVRTVVGIGVSLNVGMLSLAMDAVNAGYQFVLPRDAVAGVPAEYADAVIEHTLSLLATVVTTDDVVAAWGA